MITKEEPAGITEKEFIAKILERGKGNPIDTIGCSLYYPQLAKEGSTETVRMIEIKDLDKENPPTKESSIEFYECPLKIDREYAESVISRLEFVGMTRVLLSHSGKEALYALQRDKKGIEWGGGIDFEMINNQPRVERILSYYCEKGKVPSRIVRKYGHDVEVLFHTHPNRKFADPSSADINQFIYLKQRVCFIVADNEILILEKTRNTPKEITLDEVESKYTLGPYSPATQEEQTRMLNEIEEEFAIRTFIIPRKADLVFDLNIIRNLQ